MYRLLLALLLIGAVLFVLGLVIKAAKWLIIIAVVVWLVGLVRASLARRSGRL